ncbi:MAG TPA: N-formylglutamate deformylase [Sphingobium sp.]
MNWLETARGDAPLIIAFPHTGADLADVEPQFHSPWLARQDADWWVHLLYGFAQAMGATTIRTAISRSVIDVNRDPSGASLYPGQATTELCPTTTFDGVPLYRDATPDEAEIARRRALWFAPYHEAIKAEIARLKSRHPQIILYDAHSIRSRVPRLFDGDLPIFNIGTNSGVTCAPALSESVETICIQSGHSHVVNGRFRGGWTTRHYGRPAQGVHAIQMELAMRGYLDEPPTRNEHSWPPPYDPARAAPLAAILRDILHACLSFAEQTP